MFILFCNPTALSNRVVDRKILALLGGSRYNMRCFVQFTLSLRKYNFKL